MFNPDTPIECRPPLGMWRVVEFTRSRTQPLDLQLRAVIGDFTDFREASSQIALARYPNLRRMFNDQGVYLMGFQPGWAGQSEVGGES